MSVPFEIQIGRIVRFLSKWASTKGSSPRVSLGSEIVPVIPMWSGIENRFLDSWNLYGQLVQVSAAAGFTSCWRIRNPSTDAVVVVESLMVATIAADQPAISVGATQADLASTVLNIKSTDGRQTSNAIAIVSDQNTTAAAPALNHDIANVSLSAGNFSWEFISDINQEIPISPGQALQVRSGAVNLLLFVSCRWRERSLEESERS